ncbi:MAG TPA: UDP-N-acetylglucosamine 2-epimerase (non-hydrolyzing) [Pedomonas sp.]|uniref:non-hydrolyzing UDP-N-acetylglucosamine 2-epimerase n=1 Tax=Pedomonas sp. TaxID=2976421 RepID=UPI002F3FE416
MRVLTVFGTRPEAIKMVAVVKALEAAPEVTHAACVTGQHREMLDSVLSLFDIQPAFDLNIMKPGQDLAYMTSAVLQGVGEAIDNFRPDWVIVQGDTTTAFAGALAGFYKKCRVAHVEAGLRTGNLYSPWPEEANRRLVAPLATLHFPPTQKAGDNLRREGVNENNLFVTGNTVIDALQLVANQLEKDANLQTQLAARFSFLDPSKRLVLVTGHRRENLDGGLERVCQALADISREREDVEFVYPVHLNPNVQQVTRTVLAGCNAVHLIEPQDYLPFVYLMRRSYLIVTDSGGIQEEAPGLGKPVLVTRDTTERPEAIEAGTARLVGTSSEGLKAAVTKLLDDAQAYKAMAQARNPFGDGQAARHIVERLLVHG